MKNRRLPLPQRYINRQDGATTKTIEIIGRKKYKKLLDNNIMMVDYLNKKENDLIHQNKIRELRNTIVTLSKLLNQLGPRLQVDCPNQQSQFDI